MPGTLSRRAFLANAAAVPAATLMPTGVAAVAQPTVTTGSLIDAERGVVRSAMDGSGIGAAAVCLVEGGQVRWTEGFGHVSGQGSAAVDASTMFSIQSTSKNFAAVAVLLAVQDGILDLDVPITRYLPSFTVRSRFEHAPQERISLRLLLANRAGFTHEAPLGNNYEPASPGFDAHVRSISQTWLRFPVGTRYRYSNLGFDLAGHVIEQVAGISYPAWLQRRIFEPLGMHDSTADASIYLASKGRALGTQEGHAQVPPVTPLVVSGGVWTSAADMAKYLGFLLGGGRSGAQQLLEPHLWDEMHGFGLGGDYGLGVMRSERLYGSTSVRLLHHRGGGFGFGCVFTYCRQANAGFAAMFNRATSAGYGIGERLLDQLLSARFGPRQPRVPLSSLAPIRLNQDRVQRMAGSWIGRSGKAKIVVAGSGELQLHRGRKLWAAVLRPSTATNCSPWTPMEKLRRTATMRRRTCCRRTWNAATARTAWTRTIPSMGPPGRRRPIGNPGWGAIASTSGENRRCPLCWSSDRAGCTSMASAWSLKWSQACCSPAMAKRWISAAPSRHGETCVCSASRPWARGDGGMPPAYPRRPRPSML